MEQEGLQFFARFCNGTEETRGYRWDGDWPANIQDLELQWATALGQATSTETLQSQQQPQNQWQVHPILDGCQPPVIIV